MAPEWRLQRKVEAGVGADFANDIADTTVFAFYKLTNNNMTKTEQQYEALIKNLEAGKHVKVEYSNGGKTIVSPFKGEREKEDWGRRSLLMITAVFGFSQIPVMGSATSDQPTTSPNTSTNKAKTACGS